MRFQLYRRLTLRGYRWYWRLRAANHEIIAQSEGYARKADALVSIELVRDLPATTPVEVLP